MTTSERINKIAERREMLDAQQRAMESGKAMTIANLKSLFYQFNNLNLYCL